MIMDEVGSVDGSWMGSTGATLGVLCMNTMWEGVKV